MKQKKKKKNYIQMRDTGMWRGYKDCWNSKENIQTSNRVCRDCNVENIIGFMDSLEIDDIPNMHALDE